jgi:hypothetical protein
MFKFCYLNKNEFEKYARGLFTVLCENMSQIAPTGNSWEEDFQFWSQAMREELQNKIEELKAEIIVLEEQINTKE